MSNIVDKAKLSVAIDKTHHRWANANKRELFSNNGCPLCTYIKDTYKVPLNKGQPVGACLLCPVKYFGFSHLCFGISILKTQQSVEPEEFKNLKSTVLSKLKAILTKLGSEKRFKEYSQHVQKELDNIKRAPTVIKKKREAPVRKRRTIVKLT